MTLRENPSNLKLNKKRPELQKCSKITQHTVALTKLDLLVMAHPLEHSKSSARKFGGKPEDYDHLHLWMDETKSWFGDSLHRMFRHHSEGIFEMEKTFGKSFINSDGKTVYTRYVGEQHVREDCNNYIPSAKEWVNGLFMEKKPLWMTRTMKINTD